MKRNAVAWAALVVSSAALVSSSGLIRPMPAAPRVSAESQKAAHALSEAFGSVAEFVKPSVVLIQIERKPGASRGLVPGRRQQPFPFPGPGGRGNIDPKDLEEMLKKFFGPNFQPEKEQFHGKLAEGTGSGFIYDDKGHILTNNHVVQDAAKITVTFYDGTEAPAKVVGTDPDSDVAVIKVENTSFPALPRGSSSKLKVGELVMAFGSPFGLDQTVTQGIISATERDDVRINAYESFIQTDAAINPGNSGGPLVNLDGQVIGINSAIVTGSRGMGGSGGNDGVGFAIPIDMASNVADKLIKDGKVSRARIGIALEPLTPAFAKQFGLDSKTKGVVVGQILKGSPAEKAGLKAGDIITSFNGQPVVSVPTFRLNVAASDVGKSYAVIFYREGKEQKATLVPAPADKVVFDIEKKSESDEPETKAETPKVEVKDFGFEVQPLTPELAASLGHPKDLQGLLISSVKEGSPAEAAGLQQGEVITKVVKDKKINAVKTVKEFQDLTGHSDELALYVQPAKTPGHFVTLSKQK
ncbi:MAG: Do family serine endopeptidase [Isosphaeraceae bacterium]|nr:Do family serine endopeptidase [Isosphaeraceae bacterium]